MEHFASDCMELRGRPYANTKYIIRNVLRTPALLGGCFR